MNHREEFETHCGQSLTKLPRNDFGLQYIIRDGSKVVPCVVRFQVRSDRGTCTVSYYPLDIPSIRCLMIFWDIKEDQAIIGFSPDIPKNMKQRSHKTLKSRSELFQSVNKIDIVSCLISKWTILVEEQGNLQEVADKALALLDPDEQRICHKEKFGNCQNVEVTTNVFVRELISEKAKYWLTPAATCAADAAYRSHDAISDQNIGIQFKVANQQEKKGAYTFNRCNNYPGMLIICRPIPRKTPANIFIVIPNAQAPATINNSFLTKGSTLNKMVVTSAELASLLEGVYRAVSHGTADYTWPSGEKIDISDLRLFTKTELNTPTSAKCKKEYENILRREKLFPESTYDYPDFQDAYDVKMDGIRLQDKCAQASPNNTGYYMTKFAKNIGNVNGKRKKGPYEVDDFDVLFVNLPDSSNIFVIPAFELEKRGMFKTDDLPGTTWVSCHPPTYKPSRKSREPIWSDKYFVETQRPDVKDRVKEIFNAVRHSLQSQN